MSSEAIRTHQNTSKVIQKHSKIHQRYVKMHQKTPVFLLKYCHNKDLTKIEPQIFCKKFEIRNSKSKTNSNDRNANDQNKYPIKHYASYMGI